MKPELLSPAGTIKSMQYAFAYGADAIYAGQPRYSLRVRNNEFNKEENLAALERSMTPTLAERAAGEAYRGLAEDAARRTIAEFVTIWLLKETDWKRDPAHKVVVLFPGEKAPPLP